MSDNISFWASHISPCDPRNSAPALPPSTAAYHQSIISYHAAILIIKNKLKIAEAELDTVKQVLEKERKEHQELKKSKKTE